MKQRSQNSAFLDASSILGRHRVGAPRRPAAARQFTRASALAVVALLWGVSPAAAQSRPETPEAKPVVDVSSATVPIFVPTATLPSSWFEELRAQTVPIPQPVTPSRLETPALRRGLLVSFGALQALDAHSTIKVLKAGGREVNPLMAAIAKNTGTVIAIKAGTAVATAYFAERLSREHPKRVLVVMAVLNTVYAVVVAHNYRVARAGRG